MRTLEEKLDELTRSQNEIKRMLMKAENERVQEVNGYISEDDAVKLLGKAKIWFWRKRKDGLIPHKKLGSTVFYLKDDLFNLFEDVV
jgi:hypothetical protein